jgi:hypothetical protein
MKINKCVKCGCLIYDAGPLCTTCTAIEASHGQRKLQTPFGRPPEAPSFSAGDDLPAMPSFSQGEPTEPEPEPITRLPDAGHTYWEEPTPDLSPLDTIHVHVAELAPAPTLGDAELPAAEEPAVESTPESAEEATPAPSSDTAEEAAPASPSSVEDAAPASSSDMGEEPSDTWEEPTEEFDAPLAPQDTDESSAEETASVALQSDVEQPDLTGPATPDLAEPPTPGSEGPHASGSDEDLPEEQTGASSEPAETEADTAPSESAAEEPAPAAPAPSESQPSAEKLELAATLHGLEQADPPEPPAAEDEGASEEPIVAPSEPDEPSRSWRSIKLLRRSLRRS